MPRSKKLVITALLFSLFMIFTANSAVIAADKITFTYKNFNWKSPNGWEGAMFNVPTWFAKDMLFTGKELIRFHGGFYKTKSVGFWTYAFGLIVEQTKMPTTQLLVEETHRYFVGLARTLGDNKQKNYPKREITVTPTSAWKTDSSGKRHSQHYLLKAFDSFGTGKPIILNVKITTWLCNSKYRAIHYTLSPHKMTHPIWSELNKEIGALKCW